ncbi:MAG: DUF2252 domain-containing protein [Solirubrobacteraceae bacterium]
MPAAPLPNPEYLEHRSVAECAAHGKAARKQVPPDRHATWRPPTNRADPLTILEAQAAERIPELAPIRYGRMALSAFAFFRGGASIMAADLAGTPTGGLRAQLCGDAHLLNFGLFETPERTLIFGLNDFDETLPGPIEWDVKRLAASFEIACRDLGLGAGARERIVLATVRSYREALLAFAEQSHLDVWHARLPAEQLGARLRGLADQASAHEAKRRIHQALRRDHLRAFDRLVQRGDDTLCFVSQPPLIVPIEELLDDQGRRRYVEVMRSFLRQYRESLPDERRKLIESYRFVHIARKVVGVGSVGTRAWVVLLIGRDNNDPLLLQLKEAQRSVLAPYAGDTLYECQGRRVVEGQRLMQAASDPMLGWYDINALDGQRHEFYVRQLWDGKASIDVSHLTPKGLRVYGEICGWTLARGHARSGDRIAMAAYLGEDDAFDRAICAFASAYAETNAADHQRLVAAIADGTITAEAPA